MKHPEDPSKIRFANRTEGGHFIGHWFGHDVYTYHDDMCAPDGSIMARYGDRDDQYASQPVRLLLDHLEHHHTIGGNDEMYGEWTMPYGEYVFSDRCPSFLKAMVTAMTVIGTRHEMNRGVGTGAKTDD